MVGRPVVYAMFALAGGCAAQDRSTTITALDSRGDSRAASEPPAVVATDSTEPGAVALPKGSRLVRVSYRSRWPDPEGITGPQTIVGYAVPREDGTLDVHPHRLLRLAGDEATLMSPVAKIVKVEVLNDPVEAPAPPGQPVRVHFRRDLLGVDGPVGLDVPERSRDTFSVAGTLMVRDGDWLTLRDDAGREVLIPVSSVMAVVADDGRPAEPVP